MKFSRTEYFKIIGTTKTVTGNGILILFASGHNNSTENTFTIDNKLINVAHTIGQYSSGLSIPGLVLPFSTKIVFDCSGYREDVIEGFIGYF